MRFASAIAVALLIAGSALAAEIPQADRRSGYDFMKPDTKAMQDEDTANPGMLWVLDGEGLWKRKLGAANKACADCQDDARTSMKGVAAQYPAFDKATGRPVDLEHAAVARRTNRNRRRSATCAVHRQRTCALHAAAGPAQSRLRQLS